ncbi:stage II sporulation protein P [Peptococcaceae bacterium 1198_IL3148]
MSYSKVVRYHRRKLIAHKMRTYAYWLLAIVMMVVLWCNPYRPVVAQQVSALAGGCINTSLLSGDDPCNIVNYAIPIMAWSNQDIYKSPLEAIFSALGLMTIVNINQPEKILTSQMPLLAAATGSTEIISPDTAAIPKEEVTIPQEEKAALAPLNGPPVVAIYCTHTGETYSLTDGVDRLNGKQGGVVKAAAALKDSLEQNHKIKVVMTDKIHDEIYNDSYIQSEKTVQALIKENPELKLLLDIHRDAERPRADSFREINGKKVARIMIVVGSDARMPFPHWQQNLALARQITSKMDELYPGLSLGIRVKEGRYNQHYHTGALLMEIGTVENSTEEAKNAAQLLAEVLAAVLEEEK